MHRSGTSRSRFSPEPTASLRPERGRRIPCRVVGTGSARDGEKSVVAHPEHGVVCYLRTTQSSLHGSAIHGPADIAAVPQSISLLPSSIANWFVQAGRVVGWQRP